MNKNKFNLSILIILLFSFLVVYTSQVFCKNSTTNRLYVIQKDGKYGYINNKGKIIIQPLYDSAESFIDGLAVVSLLTINNDRLYGYINESGKIVIDIKYPFAMDFSEGYASVGLHTDKRDYKFGFIDKSGKMVIDPKFTLCSSFSSGLACVIADGSIIDGTDGKLGYINKSGNIVIEPAFDMVITRSLSFVDGIACVTKNKKRLFIDSSGKNLFREKVFSDAYNFSGNLAGVKDEKNKWGFIDKSGKCVIESAFDDVRDFAEGLAAVKVDNKWGYINKSGKIVIKPAFDDVSGFAEGLAAVKVDNKWGYINNAGKIVIKPAFDDAHTFIDGVASVYLSNGNDFLTGYINTSGSYIWKPTN